MRNEGRTLPTLEERLWLAATSQASSPEVAAKLVKRFSRLHTATLFAGRGDSDLMYDLTGEYWDCLENDLLHYGGFCRSFQLAIEDDYVDPADLEEFPEPFRPVWGVRLSNAIVLLGLMLMDHVKGGRRDKSIYHCTRMTLGQYLDALTALAPPGDEPPDPRFRLWRDRFLEYYGPCRSMPLADVLADILRRYIVGWQEFDHLDHILRCMGALACYLEQEEAGRTLPQAEADAVRRFREALCRYSPDLEGWDLVEQDKRFSDPRGYFFTLANEYPDNVADPGDKAVAAQTVRSQIYLSVRDYTPGTLRALASQSPSPDLRALLEKYVDQKRLAAAMREINTVVTDLYMLWVQPYLRMEEHDRASGRGRSSSIFSAVL